MSTQEQSVISGICLGASPSMREGSPCTAPFLPPRARRNTQTEFSPPGLPRVTNPKPERRVALLARLLHPYSLPPEPKPLNPKPCSRVGTPTLTSRGMGPMELRQVATPRPETRNPKPETRNPKPETRNPKPEMQVGLLITQILDGLQKDGPGHPIP